MTIEERDGLPGGWIQFTLGEYIEVIRGASPRPKGDPRYFGGGIAWISIRDINAERGKYLTRTAEGVTKAGAEKSRYLLTLRDSNVYI
jgi:type I restriction enzyme S subunit